MFAERGAKVGINDISEEIIKSQRGEAVFILGDISISSEAEKEL